MPDFFKRYNLSQLFTLLFFGLIFLWPTFLGHPLFDDNFHIFNSKDLQNAPSFLSFWNPNGLYFKSWPLSYSIFWIFSRWFGNNLFFYKLFNLLIHILNSYLVYYSFKRFEKKNFSFLASFIFLVHPLQIETFSWIFQLKTLLATFFILLTLNFLWKFLNEEKVSFLILAIYFFFFSLMAKSIAIVFPFFFLALFFYKYKLKKIRMYLFLIPFFLISLISGRQSLKGITYANGEKLAAKSYNQGKILKTIEITNRRHLLQKEGFKTTNSNNILHNINPLFISGFYITKFLIPIRQSLIYGFFTLKYKIFISIIGPLITFLIIFRFFHHPHFIKIISLLILYFVSIFPIMGFFYIPYMKFSIVADHWAYLATIPLIYLLLISLWNIKYKNILIPLFIFVLLFKTTNYIHIFNDRYKVLKNAISTSPDELLLYIQLSRHYIENDQWEKAKKVLSKSLNRKLLAHNQWLVMQSAFINRQLGDKKGLKKDLEKLIHIFSAMGKTDDVKPLKKEFQSL